MSPLPLPDTPYTVSAAYLTIGSPSKSTLRLDRPPSLRIKIMVDLLLPSVYTPKAGRRPRGLEELFHVAVPLGGNVQMSLDHLESCVDFFSNARANDLIEEVEDHQKELQERLFTAAHSTMRALLNSNKQALALDHVVVEDLGQRDAAVDQGEEPVSSVNQYVLFPKIAAPIYSPISNHMIPTGHPTAYLQAINIVLQWLPPGIKSIRDEGSQARTMEHSHGNLNAEENEDEDILEDYSDGIIDDGDVLLEDDNSLADDNILLYQDQQDAIDQSQRQESEDEGYQDMPDNISRGTRVPDWAVKQIETGLTRMMKIHMMRRFPLIFDGHHIKTVLSFAVPPSMPAALTSFVNTSKRFGTLLDQDFAKLSNDIVHQQEEEAKQKLQTIFSLIQPKPKAVTPGEEEGSQGSRKRKRAKTKTPTTEDLVYDHQIATRQAILRQTIIAGKAQETRLRLMLQEVLKTVGRAEFLNLRVGVGKLSISRLQLSLNGASETIQGVGERLTPIAETAREPADGADHDLLYDGETLFDDEEDILGEEDNLDDMLCDNRLMSKDFSRLGSPDKPCETADFTSLSESDMRDFIQTRRLSTWNEGSNSVQRYLQQGDPLITTGRSRYGDEASHMPCPDTFHDDCLTDGDDDILEMECDEPYWSANNGLIGPLDSSEHRDASKDPYDFDEILEDSDMFVTTVDDLLDDFTSSAYCYDSEPSSLQSSTSSSSEGSIRMANLRQGEPLPSQYPSEWCSGDIDMLYESDFEVDMSQCD